jgi:hypothetical protein
MRSLWLLAFLVAGALARPRGGYGWGFRGDGDDEDNKCDEEAAKADANLLDDVTHQLESLADVVDSMPDPTVAGLVIEDLEHELDILSHDVCTPWKQFSCRLTDHHCISSVLVCDGTEDCENGADEVERHCTVGTPAGSVWRGNVVYDHCTNRKPQTLEVEIQSVETVPYFPARPQVGAELHVAQQFKEYDTWAVLHMDGYWQPAERAVVFTAPESDGLGFTCQFFGTDVDTCVAHVIREQTFEPCAEFILHRV